MSDDTGDGGHAFADMYSRTFALLNDTTLVCRRCDVKLAKNDHFTISKHVECVTHLNAAGPRAAKNKARSSERCGDDDNDDRDDWPSSVKNYEEYKCFLERYTGREVPEDGALHGPYVALCYDETLKQIRSYVNGNKIWVSLDETYAPPAGGRPEQRVANVIVGTLEAGKPGKMFLLTVEEFRGRDYWRVGRLFDDAMRLLWPDGVRHDDVLLFLSEPLDHVLRAADSLKTAYTRMVYVTGTADAEHRVVGRVDRPLVESVALVDGLAAADDGGCWPCVRDVLNATAGYETMRAISRVLDGQADGLPVDLDAADLPFFQYAPVTLVDVRGSYAPYADMLVNAVPSYGFEIAKKTIVIQCNSAVLHGIRSSNREHYNHQGIRMKSD